MFTNNKAKANELITWPALLGKKIKKTGKYKCHSYEVRSRVGVVTVAKFNNANLGWVAPHVTSPVARKTDSWSTI